MPHLLVVRASSCSLSYILATHSSEHLSIVLFSFCFLFFVFSSFIAWLVWCVLVSGTLAFHLPYLDGLRLFGLLSRRVCDHIICTSVG